MPPQMGLGIVVWFEFYKYAAPDGAGDGALPRKVTVLRLEKILSILLILSKPGAS